MEITVPIARSSPTPAAHTGASGSTWTTVASPRGNTANVSTHTVSPVNARYVRVNVLIPTTNAGNPARIYEFEVFAN